MASSTTNQEKTGVLGRVWEPLKALPKVLWEKVFDICKVTKEIARADPRRVIHSLKVGLAISLVSLFYYYQPLYENFGLSAMWAVMTAVVVFEYTVGATLGKGLNRTMATLVAGALGVGAHYLASLSGGIGEPILIGFFVFLQAAIASFIRLLPKVKARYDYGMLIFILTFSLISVSGFRDDEVLEMAQKRLSTIFIGGFACVMISIFVCPIWAGEELHCLIADKLETLGDFLEAAIASFIRLLPKVKARYDYGMLIFILAFSLISVSGFRDDEVLEMAQKRLSTIFIGGFACVMISIFVCPVWAGEELHCLIADKLETLGDFLEAFVCEYFETSKEGDSKDNNSCLEGYKNVLNSKSSEESLANFAKLEPRHGKFKFRHPWDQYLKIGSLSRQCACRMETLNGILNSENQGSQEILCMFKEVCSEMSLESSKALKELGGSIRTMTRPSSADTHVANSKAAMKSLKSLLQSISCEETELLSLIPAVTVASLLIDIADCTEKIVDSVNDLASLTDFNIVDTDKNTKTSSESSLSEYAELGPKTDNSHVVILVEESASTSKRAMHKSDEEYVSIELHSMDMSHSTGEQRLT